MGWRYAMIASVSSAASDSRLRSVTSWKRRRSESNSGWVTKRHPDATRSRRIPWAGTSASSASDASASETAAGDASSASAISTSRTGREEEKSSASTAGRILRALVSLGRGSSTAAGSAAGAFTSSTSAVSIPHVIDREGDVRPRHVDLPERGPLERARDPEPDELQRGEERGHRLRAELHRPEEVEKRQRPLLVEPREELFHLGADRKALVPDLERRRVGQAVALGDFAESADQVEERHLERLPIGRGGRRGRRPGPQARAQRVDLVKVLRGTPVALVLGEAPGEVVERALLGGAGGPRKEHAGLDVNELRRHRDVLGGDVEVELAHRVE